MEHQIHRCPQCGSLIDKHGNLCSLCGAIIKIESGQTTQVGQTCFECGHQADRVSDHCPDCGETYMIECPVCQNAYSVHEHICPACGHDIHSEYNQAVEQNKNPVRPFAQESSLGLFARIFTVVAVLGGIMYLFNKIPWKGPQAIIGFGVLLLVFSFVAVYVIFSPSMLPTVREKKVRKKNKGKFALVYRTLDLMRAEHLKTILDSEGIPAFIYNKHATTLDPFDIFTGIRVMVPTDRVEEVKEMMPAFGFDTDDIDL